MSYPIPCDICGQEDSAQMLTNLADGTVLAIGAACLPQFYGQMTLELFQAGEHKGPATKCQACRRFHERMTTPVAPIGTSETSASWPDNPVDDGEKAAPPAENNVSRETSGPAAGDSQKTGTS